MTDPFGRDLGQKPFPKQTMFCQCSHSVVLFVAAFCLSKGSPLPCGTCPRRLIIEAAAESSSCGASEECADPTSPTTKTTKGTTKATKDNSFSDKTDTVRTPILAIAIRTGSNGSSEQQMSCSSSDCNSNGLCFGTVSDPVCLCFKGFCGPLCKWALCSGHSGCNGHGWCLASSDSAKCVCQINYWGKHCEKSKSGVESEH